MQVNSSPPTPKDSEIESKPRVQTPQWTKESGLAFSSLFTAAEKKPAPIKSVGNNVFRVEHDTDDSDSESSDYKKEATTNSVDPQPTSPPVAVTGFSINPFSSTIDFKLSSTTLPLSRTGESVMIQMISHIRGISSAYHTVQFEIPDHQVGIRITSIGSTLKIALTTPDDELRNDLKSNQSGLTHILRRELASPTLEFLVENPSQGSSSGNGGQSKQPPADSDTNNDEETE